MLVFCVIHFMDCHSEAQRSVAEEPAVCAPKKQVLCFAQDDNPFSILDFAGIKIAFDKQDSQPLYSDPSLSSASFTRSTTWPRTVKVGFCLSAGSNVTRARCRCPCGAGQSESATSSPTGSPIAFFRIGLRRPSCATTANSF